MSYRKIRRAGRVVSEHRAVVEAILGTLPAGSEVHHRDGNRRNNDPENLVVCQDRAYHVLIHTRAEAYRATGDPDKRCCVRCHRWDSPSLMRAQSRSSYEHALCNRDYQRSRRESRIAS